MKFKTTALNTTEALGTDYAYRVTRFVKRHNMDKSTNNKYELCIWKIENGRKAAMPTRHFPSSYDEAVRVARIFDALGTEDRTAELDDRARLHEASAREFDATFVDAWEL